MVCLKIIKSYVLLGFLLSSMTSMGSQVPNPMLDDNNLNSITKSVVANRLDELLPDNTVGGAAVIAITTGPGARIGGHAALFLKEFNTGASFPLYSKWHLMRRIPQAINYIGPMTAIIREEIRGKEFEEIYNDYIEIHSKLKLLEEKGIDPREINRKVVEQGHEELTEKEKEYDRLERVFMMLPQEKVREMKEFLNKKILEIDEFQKGDGDDKKLRLNVTFKSKILSREEDYKKIIGSFSLTLEQLNTLNKKLISIFYAHNKVPPGNKLNGTPRLFPGDDMPKDGEFNCLTFFDYVFEDMKDAQQTPLFKAPDSIPVRAAWREEKSDRWELTLWCLLLWDCTKGAVMHLIDVQDQSSSCKSKSFCISGGGGNC